MTSEPESRHASARVRLKNLRMINSQSGKDGIEMLVRERLQLRARAVLDRVRHVDDRRVETQRFALGVSGGSELRRDDVDSGDATTVEIGDIVQTARCA